MSVFTNRASAAKDEVEAYVAATLGLLGGRDPLDVLQSTHDEIASLVSGRGAAELREPEAPGKWSAIEIVQHLADSDLVWSYRLRVALADEEPTVRGYDQDQWAERLAYREADIKAALEQFGALRAMNTRLVASLSAEQLRRDVVHSERGSEPVADMIRLYAGHDLVHLRQLHRILGDPGSGRVTKFDRLLEEVRACRICQENLPHGVRPVVQLDARARILIAGQAPGRRVHESGVPFDDPSGDRLRDWMGVDRDTFYEARRVAILPMGFCYPGTGNSGDLPPRPECAPAWRERLLASLKRVELTLVLGKYAQAYHLDVGRRSLTEIVQSWRDYWPSRLPLPHPSPRNRGWLARNPWFDEEVLPKLRQRVRNLV